MVKKIIIYAGVALAVAAFAFSAVRSAVVNGDQRIFFAAARVVVGDDPYRGSRIGAGFLYPPFFGLACWPFAVLRPAAGAAAWFGVNAVALFFLFAFSYYFAGAPNEAFGPWLRPRLRELADLKLNWLTALAVVFAAPLWVANLRFGLVNPMLWALALAAVYFAGRGQPVAAGVALAVAAAVKPVVGSVAVYWIITRRWRALLVAGAAVVILAVAPAAVLGWGRNADLLEAWWRGVVRSGTEIYILADDYNQSLASWLYGAVNKGGGINARAGRAVRLGAFAVVIPAAGSLLVARRRRDRMGEGLALAALLLTGVVAAPLAWVNYYVVAAFGYAVALTALGQPNRPRPVRLLAASLTVASFAGAVLVSAARIFYHYKLGVWAALALYAALLVLSLARARKNTPA